MATGSLGNYYIVLRILLVLGSSIILVRCLSDTACYGTDPRCDFYSLECGAGKRIQLGNLTYGTKGNAGCAAVDHCNKSDICCAYNMNDCAEKFSSVQEFDTFKNCSGKTNCTDVQAPWALLTTCNNKVSSYVKVDYTCIEGTNIINICDTKTLSGSNVHILFDGTTMSSSAGQDLSACHCKIKNSASIGQSVTLNYVDIRLLNIQKQTNATVCSNAKFLLDGETISCKVFSTVSEMKVNNFYTGDKSRLLNVGQNLIMELSDLYINGAEDIPMMVWVEVYGTGKIEVECRNEAAPDTTTMVMTTQVGMSTRADEPTTGSMGTNADKTRKDDEEEIPVLAIVIPVVVVVILGVIIVFVILYLRKRSSSKHNRKNNTHYYDQSGILRRSRKDTDVISGQRSVQTQGNKIMKNATSAKPIYQTGSTSEIMSEVADKTKNQTGNTYKNKTAPSGQTGDNSESTNNVMNATSGQIGDETTNIHEVIDDIGGQTKDKTSSKYENMNVTLGRTRDNTESVNKVMNATSVKAAIDKSGSVSETVNATSAQTRNVPVSTTDVIIETSGQTRDQTNIRNRTMNESSGEPGGQNRRTKEFSNATSNQTKDQTGSVDNVMNTTSAQAGNQNFGTTNEGLNAISNQTRNQTGTTKEAVNATSGQTRDQTGSTNEISNAIFRQTEDKAGRTSNVMNAKSEQTKGPTETTNKIIIVTSPQTRDEAGNKYRVLTSVTPKFSVVNSTIPNY